MIFEAVCVGEFQVNCYVLARQAGSAAIIIDPGDECATIKRLLERHRLSPALVINTHGHIDHIGCDDEFGVEVYAHDLEISLLRDPGRNLSNFLASNYSVKSKINGLADGQRIGVDGIQLQVIHTPGHTPGGICLLMKEPVDNILFSGDTLFLQGIGRTDFPGADQETIVRSIKEKLLKLPDDTLVYPGHGPSSAIGKEKRSNPFLV